jgi:hypothetical protein
MSDNTARTVDLRTVDLKVDGYSGQDAWRRTKNAEGRGVSLRRPS